MRRRKRAGTSWILLLAVMLPLAEAGKKKTAPEPYGLVAGTVFKETGFALPGAIVILIPNSAQGALQVKVKKIQGISDARGEFVLRVPAVAMRYTVKVAAKGYQDEEKTVTVQGEERVDVTFQLHQESK